MINQIFFLLIFSFSFMGSIFDEVKAKELKTNSQLISHEAMVDAIFLDPQKIVNSLKSEKDVEWLCQPPSNEKTYDLFQKSLRRKMHQLWYIESDQVENLSTNDNTKMLVSLCWKVLDEYAGNYHLWHQKK